MSYSGNIAINYSRDERRYDADAVTRTVASAYGPIRSSEMLTLTCLYIAEQGRKTGMMVFRACDLAVIPRPVRAWNRGQPD
ncbi:hypothetical protein PUNSTDRAFT_120778 [Punctularia strigosozonata HHB-11173 SS5]|uniref:uncharacterized protein n=1 Tax=Punctularia strigosozonata (strain HHB-11173) TaxID=741275 RepID=UPI0004417952|nr:uncharacterized protein PUNSTDRAFT_120778 [Punctularia strigosozonata HHB-11173 SS5]EIN08408.1 hypothetical protein PUNSTDRAFT_120778 [Punctularia strigosozonata HHB-11173 SS5]